MKLSPFWVRASGLAFVVTVLGIWLWIEATPPPRVAPPEGKALVIDKSARAQGERKAMIDVLLEKGLVRRIDGERSPTLRVTLRPAFYLLDEETRRGHVDLIYRYYFDGSSVNDTIVLRDARHGNEVGSYNPYRGGLNMYK
jgi:hypothetical protein